MAPMFDASDTVIGTVTVELTIVTSPTSTVTSADIAVGSTASAINAIAAIKVAFRVFMLFTSQMVLFLLFL
jgi:hypothetical protein